MNTTKTHNPHPDATVAFRAASGTDDRPAAELVAGSAPVSENELVPLLHKRLRFLVLVLIVFHAVYLLLRSIYAHYDLPQGSRSQFDIYLNAGTLVALLGLLAVLSRPRSMKLRQLRVIDFVLIAILVVRLFLRGYFLLWGTDTLDRVRGMIATGDLENAWQTLSGITNRLMILNAMYVVAYGAVIPNTWRRCAFVVATFIVLPIAIWIVACFDHGLPTEYWFTLGFSIPALILILIGVMSVYGTYRIESSRQEASEARRLGQYVLREKIGGGGMGEVYLADHVLLRRPCAIKLIRPERAGDPAMLQRFEREVRATATLTHPNSVQVFDYGHTPDGTFYYVMEYLPGPTLEELVKRSGPLPPERAIHFLRQICGALREAHAVGLIHRDIKPSNVIVCERGRVPDVAKLLDFGLVQSTVLPDDEKLTQVGSLIGTPSFLAPEQAAGEAVDGRTDIYALGALAYFLLTGQPPFVRKGAVQLLAAHLHETPEPPRHLRPEIPADLEAVVIRCLAKKPDERYPCVNDLDQALATAIR